MHSNSNHKLAIYTTLFLLCSLISLQAQNDQALRFAEVIDEASLEKHLQILASDSLEGRETGKRGQRMAADYIKEHFKSLGLVGPVESEEPFYQMVPLEEKRFEQVRISHKKQDFKLLEDFLFFGNTSIEKSLDLIFAGSGDSKELETLDLKGKAAMVWLDNLMEYRPMMAKVSKYEPQVLVMIMGEEQEAFDRTVQSFGHQIIAPQLSLKKENEEENEKQLVYVLSPKAASTLLGKEIKEIKALAKDKKAKDWKALNKTKVSFKARQVKEDIESENVLAYLEGTDKKDELIVLTAHYDHLGVHEGEVYNGADDDGSGTVAVMQIAEAFVKATKEGYPPRRSFLFMTVTGEEKGLLGSSYYTDHPLFPLENTITNLNIDMIGRIDDHYVDDHNYVYLIGSDKLSQELHDLSEEVNETYTQIKLDYRYNDENDPNRFYYRSDHYNFAKNNIPIIFYFNGTHEDYHQPGDTVDKIHFGALRDRTRLVFYTAWELAHQEERLKLKKDTKLKP